MLVFRFDEQARKDHTRPTRLGIVREGEGECSLTGAAS